MFVLSECTYSRFPNKLREKVALCPASNSQIGLKTVNFDGYYYYPKADSTKSDNQFYIFYKDGFCSFTFVREDIDTFLTKVISNNSKSEYDDYYNRYYWGRYEIKNDTAYLVMVNHPSMMSPVWEIIEEKKCIQENYLVPHSFRLLIDRNGNYCDTNSYVLHEIRSQLMFKHFPNLPNSNLCWIKKSICK